MTTFTYTTDNIATHSFGRPDLFLRFQQRNNLSGWERFNKKKQCWPPYHDHGRTYQVKHLGAKGQIDVFHVYVGPNNELWDDICKRTLEWAAQHKKVAEIYDASHSWYYNDENGNGTALIIIHDPDVQVIVP